MVPQRVEGHGRTWQGIEELQRLRIDDIADRDVGNVAESIWEVLRWPRVGIGQTLLVANSKALHHVLPDLVPSIDRNFTLMFFVGRPCIYRGRVRHPGLKAGKAFQVGQAHAAGIEQHDPPG